MADERAPFHNPFASLARLRGDMPATAPNDPPPVPAAVTDDPPRGKSVPRAVVRLERSGRGGKEVTVVDHLDLPVPELDRWLKGLKAGLGCGGVIESGAIVLQGDQRARLPALLTSRGVKRVTMGT